LFKVTGTHSIFLTGNYVEPAGRSGVDDYDEDDEDQYGYDLEPDSDEELDYDDEEDELDDLEDPRIMEVDDDEEEVPVLTKVEKKGKNKRAAEEELDGSGLDALITKAREADASEAKSKKQKKQKKNDGSAAAVEEEKKVENGSAKSDKKVQFAKNLEQGPTPTKEQPKGALGIKKVQGVTIDDKKLGTGPAAKNGDRVGMRYIGKLEKNGQVFDSNKKGKPFTFKLGSGEVIKGWDIGIAGMTVGGERRITIPAHLAYGNRKTGEIPANSTLVFDVKLLDINRGK
jgi:FK506-binding nuclear protein